MCIEAMTASYTNPKAIDKYHKCRALEFGLKVWDRWDAHVWGVGAGYCLLHNYERGVCIGPTA